MTSIQRSALAQRASNDGASIARSGARAGSCSTIGPDAGAATTTT